MCHSKVFRCIVNLNNTPPTHFMSSTSSRLNGPPAPRKPHTHAMTVLPGFDPLPPQFQLSAPHKQTKRQYFLEHEGTENCFVKEPVFPFQKTQTTCLVFPWDLSRPWRFAGDTIPALPLFLMLQVHIRHPFTKELSIKNRSSVLFPL